MKKIFLTSVLILSLCATGYSQTQPNTQSKEMKTPQERADNQTKKWTKELALTPDQATKTNAVFLDRDTKIETIKSKYSSATDKKPMHSEIKTVREQSETSLKGIFTPEQYNKYTSMKEEKNASHKMK